MKRSTASPLALVALALSLPFRRAGAFLRSGLLMLLCWVGGFVLLEVALLLFGPAGGEASKIFIPLLVFVLVLAVTAVLTGIGSFVQNWSRVAFVFPEHPDSLPLFNADRFGVRRLLAFLRTPIRSFFGMFMVQLGVLAAGVGIFGAIFFLPELTLPAIGLLPALPIALLASFNWPHSPSAAIDAEPPPLAKLRDMATGGYFSRLLAFTLISLAAWLLIVATVWGVVTVLAEAPLPQVPLVLAPAILPVMLGLAWVNGLSALLYALWLVPVEAFD